MTDREYMENKVRHAFNKGYDVGFKDGKEKAKSQQPCEDPISRQAAIDSIENEQKKIMRSDWAIDQAKFSAMSEIRELIAELPPVSTEKTGQWIDTGSGQMCSRCGEIQHGYDNFRRFCASCGIRMVEPQESEDKE